MHRHSSGPFNFSPGPATLPLAVKKRIAEEIPNWHEGMSVLELGHRTPPVETMAAECDERFRTLLNIPKNYHVIFPAGGARGQFAAIPLNTQAKFAHYITTGFWSKCAAQEASRYLTFQDPRCIDTYVLPPSRCDIQPGCEYVHYTDNETIDGIMFAQIPETHGCPLVVDMTSSLFARHIDVSKFHAIYAAAQKNFGIAGITAVILHPDFAQNPHPMTPSILDNVQLIKHQSMLNTPPVFPWYVMDLMLQWIAEQGGVAAMAAKADLASSELYACIDASSLYSNKVPTPFRSVSTIPFQLKDPTLDDRFLEQASASGLHFLKGHRAVGGMRACLYNGMPIEGVRALVEFMKTFEASA